MNIESRRLLLGHKIQHLMYLRVIYPSHVNLHAFPWKKGSERSDSMLLGVEKLV